MMDQNEREKSQVEKLNKLKSLFQTNHVKKRQTLIDAKVENLGMQKRIQQLHKEILVSNILMKNQR
jgi:hypothetical protein